LIFDRLSLAFAKQLSKKHESSQTLYHEGGHHSICLHWPVAVSVSVLSFCPGETRIRVILRVPK